MERESGFYWVNEENLGWVVAEWDGNNWFFTHLQYDYDDSEMIEIDERKIQRQPVCNDKSLGSMSGILTGESRLKNLK